MYAFTHWNHLSHAILMSVLMSIPYLFEYNCFISLQESWGADILIKSSNGDSSNEYPTISSYLFLISVQDMG